MRQWEGVVFKRGRRGGMATYGIFPFSITVPGSKQPIGQPGPLDILRWVTRWALCIQPGGRCGPFLHSVAQECLPESGLQLTTRLSSSLLVNGLIDIQRTITQQLQSTHSSVHGMFTKVDFMLSHKMCLKFQKFEIIWSMLLTIAESSQK